MKSDNWSELIYEVYDFLYWEPQHIGKKKNHEKPMNYHDFTKHTKKIEVSLNQVLNIFFYFLPQNIFIVLLSFIFKEQIKIGKTYFQVAEISKKYPELKEFTQPDFFFSGGQENIAIEMKIKSKSSLEQVMKYILLHIKESEKTNKNKDFILIFLGEKDFSNLWREKYKSINEMKKAFLEFEIPDVTKKGKVNIRDYKEEIYEICRKARVGFISYSDFSLFCEQQINENTGNDMLIKLLIGAMLEIQERNLL